MIALEDAEAVEQRGRLRFGGITVFLGNDAFQLAEARAVLVGQIRLGEQALLLLHGFPEDRVAHQDRVDDALVLESVLVLLEHREALGPRDGAGVRLELAGEDLHEGGFARAVGAGETVAAAGRERGGHVLEQLLAGKCLGDVLNLNHGGGVSNTGLRPQATGLRQKKARTAHRPR